jgi:hypothetical protein
MAGDSASPNERLLALQLEIEKLSLTAQNPGEEPRG